MWPVFIGLLLDRALGEPKRFHPLIGFGRWADYVERICYRPSRFLGFIAWFVCVIPLVVLAIFVGGNLFVDSLLVYLAIGRKSLIQHAEAILQPLVNGDIDSARSQLARIVSRDTEKLDEAGVAKATIESVLENSNDSTFGVIFWYVCAGAPGVVLYRLANTLDAMWGYRNKQYRDFGYVAAKVDDLLNYIPARLTALSFAALGNFSNAMECWRTQAPICDSPNAGPVMTAGAGALSVQLGGDYWADGEHSEKPVLGTGKLADKDDISRAYQLLNHSVLLWCAMLLALTLW